MDHLLSIIANEEHEVACNLDVRVKQLYRALLDIIELRFANMHERIRSGRRKMGRTSSFSHPTSFPSIKNVVDMDLTSILGPTDISEFVDKSEQKILITRGIFG